MSGFNMPPGVSPGDIPGNDVQSVDADRLHTPGPWKVAQGDDEIYITDSAESSTIARTYDVERSGTALRNARLIAAAPKLLETLRDAENALMLVAMGNTELDRLEESALACAARIRAAISTAEGR